MTTTNQTADILRSMLTQNTGRALCDSGDFYGRHWQQNQGRDFDAERPSTLSFRWGVEVTHNVYHWLKERLIFNERLDRTFGRWCGRAVNEDKGYLELMGTFAERIGGKGIYGEGSPMVVNSYNDADLLSQTIQYCYWEDNDGGHVLLQIHGGCDVRGGYTSPRAFDVREELAIFDNARAAIACPHHGSLWMTDDGYHWHGESIDLNPDQPVLFGDRYDHFKRVPDLKEWTTRKPDGTLEALDGKVSTDHIIGVDDDGNGQCPYCSRTLEAWPY